jgi:perosamine synthetase
VAYLPYAKHTVGRAEERAVLAALRSERLTQGPRVEALERAFARRLGRRHAVAVSSGTAALHCAVAGLRLPPGSEVITSPLTFAATANVLVLSGLVPRFCDVDPATGVLSLAAAAAAVGARTSAILPIDYAGYPCDGRAFRALARRHDLALLEDATHLLGGRQSGRPAGAWADAAAFSLHPAKAITAGEGGVVVTDDADLARRIRRFRDHGLVAPRGALASLRDLDEPGLNYRMSDLHAALALPQLARMDDFIRRRAALSRRYLRLLGGIAGIEPPPLPRRAGDAHAWHLFVVRLRPGPRSGRGRLAPPPAAAAGRRDRIVRDLLRAGIGAQVHYRPVCDYRYYRRRWPRGGRACPEARRFAARCLTLPLFPGLEAADQKRVVAVLSRALRSR